MLTANGSRRPRRWRLPRAILGTAAAALGAYAATAQTTPALNVGNVDAGALIAARGTPRGVAACAQCHAFNGVADGSGAFPRLAGQSAGYLAKQLRDYTGPTRRNAIMTPFAKRLTEQELLDVSAYYATQADAPLLPVAPATAPADVELLRRGERIALVGLAERAVQGCNNCHGPRGIGEAPAVPPLQGQSAAYIERQFEAWRRGWRSNSGGGQMHAVADKLPAADVSAVARYYEAVRPAAPDAPAGDAVARASAP